MSNLSRQFSKHGVVATKRKNREEHLCVTFDNHKNYNFLDCESLFILELSKLEFLRDIQERLLGI